MENWRTILTEVANLSGIISNHYRDEASLVKDIVKEVQRKLNLRIDLNVATHPVGIEPRLQKLLKELCLESSDDVRIIAIWGVGGLGKTTIAKAAYNHIRSRFEGCSFVDNVRETWEQSNRGLLALQNQIRSDISKNKNYKIRNSHEGVEFLKHRAFNGRKVLLVLDDVNSVEQLTALAIDPRFLYRGSRIIVTTRDISSLNSLRPVLTKYELELLNKDESLRLFNLHAFNQHNPLEGFMEFSKTVVDYAGGIPLVLQVLGCYLNGKNDQSVWRSAITKLENIPHNDVQRKLRISFDSLDEKQQKLFLDIAFFFVGKSKNFTIQALQDNEIFPEDGFQRLVDLCLLKCDQGLVIVMHDVFKQMGREIVRQENVDYPGKRSRLWDYKDALKVLKNCEGTEAVEGLILLHNGKDIKVKAKAFQKMTKLRVLHLDHVLLSTGYKLLFRNSGHKHLSRNLVWLRWHHFDLSVLPSQLYLENLVALDLSYSNIKRVWRGTKVLKKLQVLNLRSCHNLTTLPNLSELSNLERLDLSECVRLQEVDKSIGHLHRLYFLSLYDCHSLRKLPSEMANLKSLEVLWISQIPSKCQTLTKKSTSSLGLSLNFIQGLRSLRLLDISGRSFTQLPDKLWCMTSLAYLCISGFKIACLPESICNLTKLETLDCSYCRMSNLPSELGRLNRLLELNLQGNNFCSLPESIGDLTNLESLDLRDCERLQSLPKLSSCGDFIDVSNCTSLESISLESMMNYSDLSCYNCPKLYEKYSVDKIGTSFLDYKGARSFRIMSHSWGMFPDWLQHETTNSYYAFKVPPLGVGNKYFIRCIFYVVLIMLDKNYSSWLDSKLHNKTKDCHYSIGCNYYRDASLADLFTFYYISFHVDELDLEEGDEIEISWTHNKNAALKKWGIHVSYYTMDDTRLKID
ncbi:disease resistance protein RPV1-like [Diospyros lotus]|nr:disease resistance protein RPV1-like [Diospyros lotus]